MILVNKEELQRIINEEALKNGIVFSEEKKEFVKQDIGQSCRTDFWICSFFRNNGTCSLWEKELDYSSDGIPISLEECRT